MDGTEEGDRFAGEEGDGVRVGGVGATAQGRWGVGRAGLIACELQGETSWLMMGRLCGDEFEGGEIQIGGTLQ